MSKDQNLPNSVPAFMVGPTSGGIGPGPKIEPLAEQMDARNTFFSRPVETINSFKKGLFDTAIGNLVKTAYIDVEKEFIDSPQLTESQIEAYNKDRPGLHLYDGIKQNVANTMIDDYDGKRWRDYVESYSDPSLTTKGINFVSNLAGNATDVIGLAAGALLGSFAAPEEAAMAAGLGVEASATPIARLLAQYGWDDLLGNSASRTGTNLLNKMIDGAKHLSLNLTGFTGAQVGANLIKEKSFNQDLDWDQSAWNLATAPVLGAAMGLAPIPFIKGARTEALNRLEGFFNRFTPITPEAEQTAKQTAMAQAMAGDDINVDPIIKQGAADQARAFHQEMQDQGLNPDDVVNEIDSRLQQIDKQLESNPNDPNLHFQKTFHDMARDYINNPHPDLSQGEFQDFMQGRREGMRVDDDGAVIPEKLKSPDEVLNELPTDDVTQLARDLGMPDDIVNEVKETESALKNQNIFNKMKDEMIKCLTGNPS